MKFGRKINADLYNEWRPFYLDYSGLKRELKRRSLARDWNEQDEQEFTSLLESELDKIHDFQKTKTSELSRRIRDAERAVKCLVEEEDDERPSNPESQRASTSDIEAQQHPDNELDEGSDDEADSVGTAESESEPESLDALEERFRDLEEEVAMLVADVHDLALFSKLNVTGFMKILKKHDKRTGLALKAPFIGTYLEKRPFYKYNWDALIVKLSKLYDLVRTRGHPIQGDSSAGGTQSAFVRQTTKYWVHPDNLVPLKLAILRHLPVLVFDSEKEFEAKDSAITSIYFDNEDLELYLGRLEKTEGAEAIRLRWYGDVDNKTIFVERKTHREDWTGEKSVKARFPIKEHLVNAFLRGEYTVDAEFQELVKKGKKTQQDVDSMIQLANEVQYSILTRKLQPVMRSFYNRTAFQLPGDARVRISLDTELALIREDDWDGRVRSGNNWRREDVSIDFPFERVPPEDKEIFKYGVLEVKLQTQLGQQPPKWVMELVQSHLVEAVPKFSKFIHGCATLLPNRVDLIPFWLPQMDIDILKPDTGYLSVIERPHQSQQTSPVTTTSSTAAGSGSSGPSTRSSVDEDDKYIEPVSEGEEDEIRDIEPARDEDKRTGLSGKEIEEAVAYRERMLKEQRDAEERDQRSGRAPVSNVLDGRTSLLRARAASPRSVPASRERSLAIDPLAPSTAFDKTLRRRLKNAQVDIEEENEHVGDTRPTEERTFVREHRAPPGKRVSVPVRIEPKVYFATERTFLKWMNTAVIIGTIATTLLNFTPPDDSRGLISATLFTVAALIAIAYSAGVFVYRAKHIRAHRAEGMYYDKYGPTLLCIVLFAALATNVGLRMAELANPE